MAVLEVHGVHQGLAVAVLPVLVVYVVEPVQTLVSDVVPGLSTCANAVCLPSPVLGICAGS